MHVVPRPTATRLDCEGAGGPSGSDRQPRADGFDLSRWGQRGKEFGEAKGPSGPNERERVSPSRRDSRTEHDRSEPFNQYLSGLEGTGTATRDNRLENSCANFIRYGSAMHAILASFIATSFSVGTVRATEKST